MLHRKFGLCNTICLVGSRERSTKHPSCLGEIGKAFDKCWTKGEHLANASTNLGRVDGIDLVRVVYRIITEFRQYFSRLSRSQVSEKLTRLCHQGEQPMETQFDFVSRRSGWRKRYLDVMYFLPAGSAL